MFTIQVPGDDRLDFNGIVAAVEEFLISWKKASPLSDKPILMGESHLTTDQSLQAILKNRIYYVFLYVYMYECTYTCIYVLFVSVLASHVYERMSIMYT